MQGIVEEGFRLDALGNQIAVKNIRPIDLARDELVLEKAAKVEAMSTQLKALKQELLADTQAFVDMSLERYGVKLGGKKGNITLDAFDGSYSLQVQIGEHLTFDEGLQAAKVLIDECLRDWTKDSSSELRTLVDHAFRVDKKGKLNFGAILALRRLEIEDKRWKTAMQAISDSVKVTGTSSYVRAYKRNDNGGYDSIPLNIATL